MKDNGMLRQARETAWEYSYGLMVQFTRDSGKTTKPMEMEDSFMLIEMFISENG